MLHKQLVLVCLVILFSFPAHAKNKVEAAALSPALAREIPKLIGEMGAAIAEDRSEIFKRLSEFSVDFDVYINRFLLNQPDILVGNIEKSAAPFTKEAAQTLLDQICDSIFREILAAAKEHRILPEPKYQHLRPSEKLAKQILRNAIHQPFPAVQEAALKMATTGSYHLLTRELLTNDALPLLQKSSDIQVQKAAILALGTWRIATPDVLTELAKRLTQQNFEREVAVALSLLAKKAENLAPKLYDAIRDGMGPEALPDGIDALWAMDSANPKTRELLLEFIQDKDFCHNPRYFSAQLASYLHLRHTEELQGHWSENSEQLIAQAAILDRALIRAAKDGDVKRIWNLIRQGANFYAKEVALGIAANGLDDLVLFFRSRRGVLDEQILSAAAARGHLSTVKILCFSFFGQPGARDAGSALSNAAESRHTAIVAFLLKTFSYSEKVIVDALGQAASANDSASVKLLLTKKTANPYGMVAPLRTAVSAGAGDVVETLLSAGAIEKDAGALEMAAEHGSLHIVKLLLDHDTYPTESVYNAFTSAIEGDHIDIMKELLDRKMIDINCKSGGAVKSAAYSGRARALKFLLQNGADIRYIYAEPLLDSIVRNDQLEIANLLVAAGLDAQELREASLIEVVQNPKPNSIAILEVFMKRRIPEKIDQDFVLRTLVENCKEHTATQAKTDCPHLKIAEALIKLGFKPHTSAIDAAIRLNNDTLLRLFKTAK